MKKITLFLTFCFIGTLAAYEDMPPLDDYQERLTLLDGQIEKELSLLEYPKRSWVPLKKRSDGQHIYDVVIIGGGQTGLTIAFALRKEKVDNVVIFDENERGFEGPWLTYGRMPNLRSDKYVIGPDCNVPSLTCQAWFQAKYGVEEWDNLPTIPRIRWAEYLQWFRHTLKLPLVNNTKVGALAWDEQEHCFIVPTDTKGDHSVCFARKVVLATGFQGSGEWVVPELVKKNLPETHYTSVYGPVNFEQLRGKKVGILGAGACGFDAATLCHEYGAEEIHLFFRRDKIPNLSAYWWGEFTGFLSHFSELEDIDKWKFVSKICEMGQPPTARGVAHVRSLPNVIMHFNSPWVNLMASGPKSLVSTPQEAFEFDHILVATGAVDNLALRSELTGLVDQIAVWGDRFSPPDEHCNLKLLLMPYLGKNFEFTEKKPGQAPYVSSIFNCTAGALLSDGVNAGIGLIGMKYSIPKVVYGIVKELFLEDKDYFYHSLDTYDEYLFDN